MQPKGLETYNKNQIHIAFAVSPENYVIPLILEES